MVQTAAVPAQKVNGPALRAIRESRGVSCSALARAVGTDVSFLARVERGEKHGVRRETFERIVWELQIADPRAIMANPFGVGCVTTPLRDQIGPTVVSSSCNTSTAA